MKIWIGYNLIEDNLLHEQPLLWRAANWDYGVEQCREHCWPGILFPKLRSILNLMAKAIGAIKPVINWFGYSLEIAPVQELGEPSTYLPQSAEFIGSHQASVPDSGQPYEASHRYCRDALDILK